MARPAAKRKTTSEESATLIQFEAVTFMRATICRGAATLHEVTLAAGHTPPRVRTIEGRSRRAKV